MTFASRECRFYAAYADVMQRRGAREAVWEVEAGYRAATGQLVASRRAAEAEDERQRSRECQALVLKSTFASDEESKTAFAALSAKHKERSLKVGTLLDLIFLRIIDHFTSIDDKVMLLTIILLPPPPPPPLTFLLSFSFFIPPLVFSSFSLLSQHQAFRGWRRAMAELHSQQKAQVPIKTFDRTPRAFTERIHDICFLPFRQFRRYVMDLVPSGGSGGGEVGIGDRGGCDPTPVLREVAGRGGGGGLGEVGAVHFVAYVGTSQVREKTKRRHLVCL